MAERVRELEDVKKIASEVKEISYGIKDDVFGPGEMLNEIENTNIFQTKEVKSLDNNKQVELFLVANEFRDSFKEFIDQCESQNCEEITLEMVQEFLNKFQNKMNK